MSSDVRMTKGRILVQRIKTEEKTAGGIYIPDVARKLLPEGKVLSVGPDVKTVQVDDIIIFQARCNVEIGEQMILEEDVILGVRAKEGLIPITDRVFITRRPPEKKKRGIHVPDIAKENMPEGQIISTGPDILDVNIGDVVLFHVRDGIEVDDLLVMREQDIIAVKG